MLSFNTKRCFLSKCCLKRGLTNLFIRSFVSFTNVLNELYDFCLIFFQVQTKDPFQFGGIVTDGSSKRERVVNDFIECKPRVVEQISPVSRHVDI